MKKMFPFLLRRIFGEEIVKNERILIKNFLVIIFLFFVQVSRDTVTANSERIRYYSDGRI
jgi:hypothetical protein